jgi:uncharacterized protein
VPVKARTKHPALHGLFLDAARNVEHSAVLLQRLLRDYPDSAGLAEDLRAAEHVGDRLTHDIVDHLRVRGGDSPIEAADGYALAQALDDIVDFAEQAGDWLGLYHVEAPMQTASDLADALVQAAQTVCVAVEQVLRAQDAAESLRAIRRLEKEADRIVREGIAGLFCRGIDPMVVVRWKDIYESVEDAVDACKTVGSILEGVVLKARRH